LRVGGVCHIPLHYDKYGRSGPCCGR
jgi:hypothetical protein